MNKEQLEWLKQYIDTVIKEKIEDAFGRDGLIETIARNRVEKELDKVFGFD